jgi:hypothetical protein
MTENGTTDRIVKGRAVYARNFGVTEAKAEALMTERAGREFTQEAFNAAGGTGWQSIAPDRPRPQHRRHRRTRESKRHGRAPDHLPRCGTAERSRRTGPHSGHGAAHRLHRPTLHLAGDGDGETHGAFGRVRNV